MSRIGSRVKALRTSKGMTQKQLAKAIGVAEKFIDEVEWGKRVLSDDQIKRISKVLEQDISDIMLAEAEEKIAIPAREVKEAVKPVKREVQEVWSDAFDSILKTVPIYDYTLANQLGTRQLPVVSNKIEGFNKDKVAFLEIQDNDLIDFRVVKGDLAFIHITHEIENNTLCLVEYDGRKAIRQLKKLDQDKLLLISNSGRLITETVSVKNLKVLARLVKLEIKL